MPIETLDDIIEQLADEIGVYGAHDEDDEDACHIKPCRMCWTSSLHDHLIAAFKIEEQLRAPLSSSPKEGNLRDWKWHLWKFVHNAIIHPMLSLPYEPKWAQRVHDWTAKRCIGGG